ncbi:unnamed protein product [Ceratitis capitata]|uniref:(Mediterranean fruit fly) hypothetical protein n=1 Tax=Ceratitis capitata TaxID=7213 RepID=A0A811UPB1_CERCA|nr:unnamed protein product [Ceratitis capitata]
MIIHDAITPIDDVLLLIIYGFMAKISYISQESYRLIILLLNAEPFRARCSYIFLKLQQIHLHA